MAVKNVGKVVVAMSGGVDSSVSAYLLKRQGFSVEGVFMKNWDERDELGVCNADRDYEEVERICAYLQIPCHQVNFVRDYWNEVFTDFLADHQRGLTPNPDVLCNHKIKFGSLLAHARQQCAAHLATGHYAQIFSHLDSLGHRHCELGMAVDANKDQTYFLAGLDEHVLSQVQFPVGNLAKHEVKALAREIGLKQVAAKKESMGICFIGKRNFAPFLQEYLQSSPGPIVHISDGRIVGTHCGIQFYTLGQGARVQSQKHRLLVVGKHTAANTLFVTDDHDRKEALESYPSALLCKEFIVGRLKWTTELHAGENLCHTFVTKSLSTLPLSARGFNCHVRVRHRQPLAPACVLPTRSDTRTKSNDIPLPIIGYSPTHTSEQQDMWEALRNSNDAVLVSVERPVRAVTPGQFTAFYDKGVCRGGGTILAVKVLAHSF